MSHAQTALISSLFKCVDSPLFADKPSVLQCVVRPTLHHSDAINHVPVEIMAVGDLRQCPGVHGPND